MEDYLDCLILTYLFVKLSCSLFTLFWCLHICLGCSQTFLLLHSSQEGLYNCWKFQVCVLLSSLSSFRFRPSSRLHAYAAFIQPCRQKDDQRTRVSDITLIQIVHRQIQLIPRTSIWSHIKSSACDDNSLDSPNYRPTCYLPLEGFQFGYLNGYYYWEFCNIRPPG